MDPIYILYPVCALVALTYVVLLQIPFARFRAVFRRRVTVDDFKLGESPNVPPDVALPNRNYMNLLQLPVLFYALALALFVTRQVDQVALIMAWIYVGLRCVHSAIHLIYNNVVHRLAAFAASNLLLFVMWVRFFTRIV
jgi:hypothetical protein